MYVRYYLLIKAYSFVLSYNNITKRNYDLDVYIKDDVSENLVTNLVTNSYDCSNCRRNIHAI